MKWTFVGMTSVLLLASPALSQEPSPNNYFFPRICPSPEELGEGWLWLWGRQPDSCHWVEYSFVRGQDRAGIKLVLSVKDSPAAALESLLKARLRVEKAWGENETRDLHGVGEAALSVHEKASWVFVVHGRVLVEVFSSVDRDAKIEATELNSTVIRASMALIDRYVDETTATFPPSPQPAP